MVLFIVLGQIVFLPEQFSLSAEPAMSQAQRDRAKAQKQKQKERKKAQKQKQRERKKAQKLKQKARKNDSKAKAADRKQDKQDQEQFRAQVERIEKHNQRVLKSAHRDIHHHIGLWGQVGYSNLFMSNLNTDLNIKTLGGVGGGVGLGYQLNYQHFLLNTGLEFNMYNSATRFLSDDATTLTKSFEISPYPSMEYVYNFKNFADKSRTGYLQIPVLAGGEWGRWYFMAGPKIGLSVMADAATSSLVSTHINDNQLMGGVLENMPSHALITDVPYQGTREKLKLGLNLALHAEAGLYLDEWFRPNNQKNKSTQNTFFSNLRYRVGIFAEYGVLNIQSSSNTIDGRTLPVRFNDMSNPLDLSMLPMLTTDIASNARVNPFLVGVKVSIFYELPRKQQKLLPLPEEPQPRMAVRVVNAQTHAPLSGAMLSIYNVDRQRAINKTTGKNGIIVQRQRRGNYQLWAQRSGYLPSDTISVDHQNDLQDTITIFVAPIPKPLEPMLAGWVYDMQTDSTIEAQVVFTNLNGQLLYEGGTSEEGEFVTDLKAGDYLAHITAVGYMPKDDTIHFISDPLRISMQRIVEGKKVILKNMFFATNMTKILPESEPTLEELANFMKDNPTISIRIIGHTDAVGSVSANQRLSEGRAQAVRQDLIMRGIDANRIQSEGRGKSEPIADNDTEQGRSMNRRVEIEIINAGDTNIEQVKE